MKHWQRTANLAADRLAQLHISEILRLAFSTLEHEEDMKIAAKRFLSHRMNEHYQASQQNCSCDICNVYKRIESLQNTLHIYQSALTYDDNKSFYRKCLKDVHKALFATHNKRRRLMGLPEKYLYLGGAAKS